MQKINLANKFSLFSDCWSPKIAAELNDSYVKLAKLKGEFVWHHHESEDDWKAVAQVHGAFFKNLRPATIVMQVVRFTDPDWFVEIEADAVTKSSNGANPNAAS